MNNIIYDDLIITPKYSRWKYYGKFIKKLDSRDCVKVSLFCAKIVSPNTKENNYCIKLVEKWLIDKKAVTQKNLWEAWSFCVGEIAYTIAVTAYSINPNSKVIDYYTIAAINNSTTTNIDIINKYLQILLRKTKQFQNNKVLEQISKVDVDKLELVDWNMITDIMQEEYNIIHDFEYEDIFSRRCLIELLRREYL